MNNGDTSDKSKNLVFEWRHCRQWRSPPSSLRLDTGYHWSSCLIQRTLSNHVHYRQLLLQLQDFTIWLNWKQNLMGCMSTAKSVCFLTSPWQQDTPSSRWICYRVSAGSPQGRRQRGAEFGASPSYPGPSEPVGQLAWPGWRLLQQWFSDFTVFNITKVWIISSIWPLPEQ